mmetsp:Transcript_39635/g.48092  ORF Transcript_39635/g.48092 Transcript_39635/m.48092 type:complete len:387 (-) Transcript_39635:270-1430(-)|eukprot:CAMPEP_0197863050 /NCGR_PEP_ID=MMETSP1438-20131217/40231_1 /TAXON_ID=1461541 /ORGANISM="Pterosperma sp., Strain CCMP1384" /LENGTH=386 /DNA_ID=CAMNT_0043480795 /DNA_START=348 /DNA_END=1508 /DNA_ORIENTATION=-
MAKFLSVFTVLSTALMLAQHAKLVVGKQHTHLHEAPPEEEDSMPVTEGPTFDTIHGTDVVWEFPNSSWLFAMAKFKPVGTLLVAHGCSHSATDFWPASSVCPQCLGLPEEMKIREVALRRGYTVVAVSSTDRDGSKCWNTELSERNYDVAGVVEVVKELKKRKVISHDAPLFAFGASSGGAFVSLLPHYLKLEAINIQIMPAIPASLATPLPDNNFFPPTLFVHMNRDRRTADMVRTSIHQLKSMDLGGADGRVKVRAAAIPVYPRAVTADFLSSRSPVISHDLAEKIVSAFKYAEIVNADGLLIHDPRQSKWRSTLRSKIPEVHAGKVKIDADTSDLSELLNLAYARHEIVSDFMEQSIDWMEGKELDNNSFPQEEISWQAQLAR